MSFEDEDLRAAIKASLVHKQNGTSEVSQPTDGPTSSRPPEYEAKEEGLDLSMQWVESDYTALLIPEDPVTRILIRCLDGSRRSTTFSQTQPIKVSVISPIILLY